MPELIKEQKDFVIEKKKKSFRPYQNFFRVLCNATQNNTKNHHQQRRVQRERKKNFLETTSESASMKKILRFFASYEMKIKWIKILMNIPKKLTLMQIF